jgi:fructuronate reductase
MSPRLNANNLPANALPYARDVYLQQGGVVHFGIGAFHRAHQAVYFDQLARKGVPGFAVTGVSLRSLDVSEQLNPQDGLYGVLQLADDALSIHTIGVQKKTLHAPSEAAMLMQVLCDAKTWLVTLTITEKGYCHVPASGALNLQHPDIQYDLSPAMRVWLQSTSHDDLLPAPRSAIAFLAYASAGRRQLGHAPLVVLSCDNLPHNGKLLAELVRCFAQQIDPELADYIAQKMRFPCSMVDRIVPATTDVDRDIAAQNTGLLDAALVKAEPFSQWVIEAVDERLSALVKVGALLVSDVAAFETMKLRLLNGSHSALAYLGYLAGHEFVADAMRAPGFDEFVQALMRAESAMTLQPPAGFDLAQYQDDLRARFRNRALKHRTWQIAMDGSQKIPQRWLQSILHLRQRQRPHRALSLALAAWLRYIGGRDEDGNAIDVRDPYAARFANMAIAFPQGADYVRAVLAMPEIFPDPLRSDAEFISEVTTCYAALLAAGAARCVQEFSEAAVDTRAV